MRSLTLLLSLGFLCLADFECWSDAGRSFTSFLQWVAFSCIGYTWSYLLISLPYLSFYLSILSDATDVALAHVNYLTAPSSADSIRYLLWGGIFTWAHAVAYITKKYPELISRLPKGWEEAEKTIKDKGEEKYCKLDTSEAKKQLGIGFKGWEETLEESLQSLLELEKGESWN